MTEFESQMIDGPADALFEQHGQPVLYNGVSVDAIIGGEQSEDELGENGIVLARRRTVSVMRSDVSECKRGDIVTFDGRTWDYESTRSRNGAITVAVFVRREQAERSRREYRR